ncbi:MAG: DUF969 domain-containing protein [Aerococcaceae bacterium]|nr:DUF969 domain-containing protein [Aerococcaceae bacterium]
MEWIKLIGILVIVVGFFFKFDTIATVLFAGLVTALVSGISIETFLETLGKAFVDQRFVSFFFLTLPMIGLAENYGLKQRAVAFIQKVRNLSMSTFLSLYLLIRLIAGFFSLRLGGHPQFVRPLIHPMSEAAAENAVSPDTLDADEVDAIKGLAAANENFGNFFGQNTFVGAGGVLLISGTLTELGYTINVADIAAASVPIAIATLIVGTGYNFWMYQRILNKHKKGGK